MRAVQIHAYGGPEVLGLAVVPVPEPGDGQVLIRVHAAGVNYADTHTRTDEYLLSETPPFTPGGEVVGVRVDADQAAERVLALCGNGGYAEFAVAPQALTFPLPDAGVVSDEAALALLVQGVTAWHLLRTSARLAPGESVVVHAAAGGVGSIAVQLAKRWGAGRVIATASTPEKRDLALALGADVAIDPSPEGLCDRIRAANDGRKVDVVLEMTGGDVLTESLAALARFGRLAHYGNASRQLRSIPSADLMRGSRAVIGFWLMECAAQPGRLIGEPLAELLALVAAGELRTIDGGRYPLADAARAHADLESRRTSGKLILDPVTA
jgi:NADPH2:quinone reductase